MFVAITLATMESSLKEMLQGIANRVRSKRLALNMTQVGLAQRSGVSLGSIKLFERTGKISLESMVKIANAIGELNGLESLFEEKETEIRSIDELLRQAKSKRERKRGRLQ